MCSSVGYVYIASSLTHRRGANVIAERARFLQQEVRNTINRAPKSIQGVLSGVQQRIADARLRARLEASKDAKVDVQVGLELFEGIPQEWRSRLWMALLQHPACADGFGDIVVRVCMGLFTKHIAGVVMIVHPPKGTMYTTKTPT